MDIHSWEVLNAFHLWIISHCGMKDFKVFENTHITLPRWMGSSNCFSKITTGIFPLWHCNNTYLMIDQVNLMPCFCCWIFVNKMMTWCDTSCFIVHLNVYFKTYWEPDDFYYVLRGKTLELTKGLLSCYKDYISTDTHTFSFNLQYHWSRARSFLTWLHAIDWSCYFFSPWVVILLKEKLA